MNIDRLRLLPRWEKSTLVLNNGMTCGALRLQSTSQWLVGYLMLKLRVCLA